MNIDVLGGKESLESLEVGDILYISQCGYARYYMIINSEIEGQFSLMETTSRKDYKPSAFCSSSIQELVMKECSKLKLENEYIYVGWGSSQNRAEILKYAVKHGYKPVKTMTLDQIESILGHRVIIVK